MVKLKWNISQHYSYEVVQKSVHDNSLLSVIFTHLAEAKNLVPWPGLQRVFSHSPLYITELQLIQELLNASLVILWIWQTLCSLIRTDDLWTSHSLCRDTFSQRDSTSFVSLIFTSLKTKTWSIVSIKHDVIRGLLATTITWAVAFSPWETLNPNYKGSWFLLYRSMLAYQFDTKLYLLCSGKDFKRLFTDSYLKH